MLKLAMNAQFQKTMPTIDIGFQSLGFKPICTR